jgi:hypothetical protein
MATTDTDDADIAGLWSDHFDLSTRTESVRAKVVLAACFLDELLGQLLRAVLKPAPDKDSLFEGAQAPLGTFSAKIDLAHRTDLIDVGFCRSLHFVRKIRNEFAHNLNTCSFEMSEIRNWNSELHRLNDVATPERRQSFTAGPVGDFEKSVSWLIYWLRRRIESLPSACHHCGSEMDHRKRIQGKLP